MGQGRLSFTTNGFSIVPLEAPAPAAVYQVLEMLLPVSDRFAPNVQIQPYAGTVDKYLELTTQQFAAANFKMLRVEKGKTSGTLEYTGTIRTRELHFYGKVVLRGGKAYLATGTATTNQWPAVKKQIVACVESLKLTP